MNDIELFFKIVESEIRRKHIVYLKKQKCNSAAQPSPAQSPAQSLAGGAELDADEFPADKKLKYVKRFNKGIETALKVLQAEYKSFSKRMESEASRGKKF